MDFLRSVEDDLRALSVEAKKKHPVIKEAAERGIVKLRTLREQYAAAVRQSGESMPVSRLRSQEVLRPFLLACNHSDCSKAIILHALGSITHLINKDAISPSDAPNILRVLAIQAVSPSAAAPEVHVKVLQTLLLTITWRACDLAEDMLASALIICIQLTEHRNATVRNAAQATLRQVVSLMFDRIAELHTSTGGRDEQQKQHQAILDGSSSGVVAPEEEEAKEGEGAGGGEGDAGAGTLALPHVEGLSLSNQHGLASPRDPPTTKSSKQSDLPILQGLSPVEKCAYYLIQDLCLVCRGETGVWIKHMRISPVVGMELIDQILSQHPGLFKGGESQDGGERKGVAAYAEVLRNQICPLIVQTLRSDLDFPLLVRLMRTITTLLSGLAESLLPQCEVILAMLIQILATAESANEDVTSAGSRGANPTGSGGGTASAIATTATSLLGAAVALGAGAVGAGGGGGKMGGGRGGGGGGRLKLWTVMLTLDVLGTVCADSCLLKVAFQNYDLSSECTNVLALMVQGLCRFAVSPAHPPSVVAAVHAASASGGWNAKGLPESIRGYDVMVRDGHAPPITEGEVVLNAVGCLLALVDTMWSLVLEDAMEGGLRPLIPSAAMLEPVHAKGGGMEGKQGHGRGTSKRGRDALHLREMLVKEDVWRDLMRFFAHLLTFLFGGSTCHSSGDDAWRASDRLFDHSLVGLERLSLILGVLGIVDAEACILSLSCRLALPSYHLGHKGTGDSSALSTSLASVTATASSSLSTFLPSSSPSGPVGSSGGGAVAIEREGEKGNGRGGTALSQRQAKAIRALLRLVSFLANRLDPASWEIVVEAFDLLDSTLQRAGGGEVVVPAASAPATTGEKSAQSSLQDSPARTVKKVDSEDVEILNALSRFTAFTALAEEAALVNIVRAYAGRAHAVLQLEGSDIQPSPDLVSSSPRSSINSSLSFPAALAAPSGQAPAFPSGANNSLAPGPSAFASASNNRPLLTRNSTAAAFRVYQLVRIAAFNIYRFECIANILADALKQVACSPSATVRIFATASLADLIIKALGRSRGGAGVKEKLDSSVGYPSAQSREERNAPPAHAPNRGDFLSGNTASLFYVKAELDRLPDMQPFKGQAEGPKPPSCPVRAEPSPDVTPLCSPQVQLLRPLADLGGSTFHDTREHALHALFRVLQSSGHILDSGWSEVFNILGAVVSRRQGEKEQGPRPTRFPDGSCQRTSFEAPQNPSSTFLAQYTEGRDNVSDSPQSFWGESCLPAAFRSLKLIVDDNLEHVPPAYFPWCVACIGGFAAQPYDVNMSLAAMGMVWTVADFVSRLGLRQVVVAQRTASGEEDGGLEDGLMDVIWSTILEELGSRLALDPRPEVRNCAVNTFFACFVRHGLAFPRQGWPRRVESMAALVGAIEERASRSNAVDEGEETRLEQVGEKQQGAGMVDARASEEGAESSGVGGTGGNAAIREAPRVILHHSRDTAPKQWSETRVLSLQGLGRFHRTFFRLFWSHDWYPSLWSLSLRTAQAGVVFGARPPNSEVALAGTGVLFLLLQLSSKAGPPMQGPLRAAVGMKVVDGALEHAAGIGSRRDKSGGEAVSDDGKNQVPLGSSVEEPSGSKEQQRAFVSAKKRMWEEAWLTVRDAVDAYQEDRDGEIAAAFLVNLRATYEGGRAVEFESAVRAMELVTVVEGLVNAREASRGGERGRVQWRPSVLSNQREVLRLLRTMRHEDAAVWEAIFALLTQHALGRRLQAGPGSWIASEPTGLQVALSTLSPPNPPPPYPFFRIPTTPQFAKEAADCLTELYDQTHVPPLARATVFDALVQDLGHACLQAPRARRALRSNAGRRNFSGPRTAWIRSLARFGARKDGVRASLPMPLASVQSSGSLLRSVLRQGLSAARTAASGDVLGIEGKKGCDKATGEIGNGASRKRSSTSSSHRSRRNSLGCPPFVDGRYLWETWEHAFWAVEGFLIPWVPGAGKRGGEEEDRAMEEGVADSAVSAGRRERRELEIDFGTEERLLWMNLKDEGYTSVGEELLRIVADEVCVALEDGLRGGVVGPLVDLLVDVLLSQGALVGASGCEGGTPIGVGGQGQFDGGATGEKGVAATDEGEKPTPMPNFVYVKVAFGHMRRLFELLLGLVADLQAMLPSSTPTSPSLPSASTSTRTALVLAIQAARRLVSGLIAVARFFMDQFQGQSRVSKPMTPAFDLAEAHLLILLHYLQAIRVPDWALPSTLPLLMTKRGEDWAVPDWINSTSNPRTADVNGERKRANRPASSLSATVAGKHEEDQEVSEGEDEDEEQEEDDLLSYLHASMEGDTRECGHVLLLANALLRCIGTSSAAVSAATVELLSDADLTGNFLELWSGMRAQQRELSGREREMVELRERASRLSVSSVAGFF